MYQSVNKKYIIFFPYFSCSLYVYAWAYVHIWMLHSWVHASRLRIFMLTRQKQQLHVHRLFQLMGTGRKKYLIFYRSSLACTCTATGHSELDFDVNRPSPYTIHNIQNFADNPWPTLSTKLKTDQLCHTSTHRKTLSLGYSV